MIVVREAGDTNTGRKRRRNEDSFVKAPPLFAIADGMGGAQAGEIASRLAVAALEDTDHGELRGEEGIVALIQEANRRVYERSNEDPSASGMGTTLTLALVEQDGVRIGHVGDSRAYLVRDGELRRITEDHSLVNELMKSGKLSPEEAETHPQRSVITRALGTDPDVDVDTYSFETRPGDLFLLCSDGLTSMVDEETILAVLERHRDDLDAAVRKLIDAANRGGGEDNITVVAFEIGGAEEELAETRRLPVQHESQPEPDDEDTLDGLPAPVDTMVVRPEDVERLGLRQEPFERETEASSAAVPVGPRLRLIWTSVLLVLLLVGLVLWGLLR